MMVDSDTDDDIFITQNSFFSQIEPLDYNTDNVIEMEMDNPARNTDVFF
jgi:hypothetical protein